MTMLKYHQLYYDNLIFVQTGLLTNYHTVHFGTLLAFAGKRGKTHIYCYLIIYYY